MTYTPWGNADGAEHIARGIMFYSTPSHGGYHLSPARNLQVPDALRLPGGWYEEDCDWARVVLAFPQYFPDAVKQAEARQCLRAWVPSAYERFYGVTLQPGESYAKDHPLTPA